MIVCYGELVQDVYEIDGEPQGVFPGGSPLNVAMGLKFRGVDVELWGIAGTDQAGNEIVQDLERRGLRSDTIVRLGSAPTRRFKVQVVDVDKMKCSPLNHPSADQMVAFEELQPLRLKNVRLLHFTAVPLLSPKSSETLLKLIGEGKKAGSSISFDPNIAAKQIRKSAELKERVRRVAEQADIIKLDEELISAVWGKGTNFQLANFSGKVVFITEDKSRGVVRINNRCIYFIPEKVKCIDPNGAGDAFLAGVYSQIYPWLPTHPLQLPGEVWRQAVALGVKMAADVVGKVGGCSAF
ncbi:MAG: aminoimidazole riboside kinase [Calditrichia bacterium]